MKSTHVSIRRVGNSSPLIKMRSVCVCVCDFNDYTINFLSVISINVEIAPLILLTHHCFTSLFPIGLGIK